MTLLTRKVKANWCCSDHWSRWLLWTRENILFSLPNLPLGAGLIILLLQPCPSSYYENNWATGRSNITGRRWDKDLFSRRAFQSDSQRFITRSSLIPCPILIRLRPTAVSSGLPGLFRKIFNGLDVKSRLERNIVDVHGQWLCALRP